MTHDTQHCSVANSVGKDFTSQTPMKPSYYITAFQITATTDWGGGGSNLDIKAVGEGKEFGLVTFRY